MSLTVNGMVKNPMPSTTPTTRRRFDANVENQEPDEHGDDDVGRGEAQHVDHGHQAERAIAKDLP